MCVWVCVGAHEEMQQRKQNLLGIKKDSHLRTDEEKHKIALKDRRGGRVHV